MRARSGISMLTVCAPIPLSTKRIRLPWGAPARFPTKNGSALINSVSAGAAVTGSVGAGSPRLSRTSNSCIQQSKSRICMNRP
ncbi:Uncharacterised protein [Mycobacteroides abscessus subsp. abscessus]|nr:Uncharacterised protein [Mycobacteroides abscessus subsp. abscessus]